MPRCWKHSIYYHLKVNGNWFLRVSMCAPCSVHLHTWPDAVSNKEGLSLMWCPTQRLLPLSRQYSNSLLGLPLQRCAALCRETLNSGSRQALLNTHSPPGQWGVGWMSPNKSRWPGLLSLWHHTYAPQVTGGLLGIGISALSCPLRPEHTRLLWENTAQDAEIMQILDCCFQKWFENLFFFFGWIWPEQNLQNVAVKMEKVKVKALPLSARLALLSFVFNVSVNASMHCCCSVIHCYDLKWVNGWLATQKANEPLD